MVYITVPWQRRGFRYAVASIYDWGCGADGSGQHRYGQLLMALRTHLRQRAPSADESKEG